MCTAKDLIETIVIPRPLRFPSAEAIVLFALEIASYHPGLLRPVFESVRLRCPGAVENYGLLEVWWDVVHD